ncbi:MAG: FtsX-like permease family protein, partial [Halobacteriaceae archaeon]
PGSYVVSASVGDRTTATETYRVTGDPRLASALATRGIRHGGTGIGQAVSTLVGNISLLLATLLMFAGLMVIGGISASFTAAISARRETIGIRRAIGGSPTKLIALVFKDSLRIGLVAVIAGILLGTALAQVLSAMGFLTAFGFSIHPLVGVKTYGVLFVGGMSIVIVGSIIAILPLLYTEPARIFEEPGVQPGDHDDG